MKYAVRIYCKDCTGEDEYGCNGGDPWMLTDDDGKVLIFDTEDAADDAGVSATNDCGPWGFEVVECGGGA